MRLINCSGSLTVLKTGKDIGLCEWVLLWGNGMCEQSGLWLGGMESVNGWCGWEVFNSQQLSQEHFVYNWLERLR